MIAIKVPPLGETVVELDTDKVTVEVPALKSGVLASQAKREGDTVKVDDLLGEVDETAAVAPATVAAASAPASAAATPAATAAAPTPAAATAAGTVRAAPSAQRLTSK